LKLILPVLNFNLGHTLECGQAFRWERYLHAKGFDAGVYYGVIGRALVKVRYDNPHLILESDTALNKKEISEYFGLNDDLKQILGEIDVDKNIHKAIVKFRGLRILKQEPWECLASYILSINNNIPRIKILIERLSELFGSKLSLDGIKRHTFPKPDKIANADLKTLKGLKLGFRARFLKNAARKIAHKKFDLADLKDLSYDEAKERLISLEGVGEKVADCALLFSFKKYEAFPVDVWIKRYMESTYFNGKKVSANRVGEFARQHFGRYAGYAQEYLYHYVRCK